MTVVNNGIREMRKAGVNYSGQIILPTEQRADIQATVATQGKENVPTDKLAILEPLRANIVFDQLGVTMMTGLVGDISIPVFSGNNVTWEGEVAAAKDGAGTFTEVKLAPKRLTAYVDVSKQFLIQDSNSAEEMLKRDIVNAINDKLQATVFGTGAGDTTTPKGIFASAATLSTVDFANIVAMEQALEEKNVMGDIKFLLSPAAKATLKTTAKDAGSGIFLMEGNEVNGYQAVSTSSVASNCLAMGKFDDLVVAQWGAIDLTVDPYTQASYGKVRLVINAYFDAVIRRADSFVTKKISNSPK
jgi:HK97 family phage major capsid protein